MNDRNLSERGQVFSAPIRKLSADEIDLVLGGGPFTEEGFSKTAGGVDNHSHEM